MSELLTDCESRSLHTQRHSQAGIAPHLPGVEAEAQKDQPSSESHTRGSLCPRCEHVVVDSGTRVCPLCDDFAAVSTCLAHDSCHPLACFWSPRLKSRVTMTHWDLSIEHLALRDTGCRASERSVGGSRQSLCPNRADILVRGTMNQPRCGFRWWRGLVRDL